MIICVQGLGYVGSAMCVAVSLARKNFKSKKFNVIGVEQATERGKKIIEKINTGVFPFISNDKFLKSSIKKVVKKGILRATDSQEVYKKADVVIVSINCDLKKINGKYKINLTDFRKSIYQIANKVKKNTLIIIESTVPPGTCKKIVYEVFKKIFIKRKLDIKKINISHSFERVTPGKNYLNSIINNWRVYSGINKLSAKKCNKFLKSFINTKKYPLKELQDTESSELCKLMENSYRAVNIAFVEEWTKSANRLNVDLFEIIDAIKKRPTHNNLKDPGFGVGGYCLAKDPLMAKVGLKQLWNINQNFEFSEMAIRINRIMPLTTINRIKLFFKNNLKGIKILLLGITYKEDIADTRNSPSELFFKKMTSLGAKVVIHDPIVNYWEEINSNVHKKIPNINKFDAVVFAVKHKEYEKINFKNCKPKNKNFLLYDANNVLSSKQKKILKKLDLNFISAGGKR